MNYYIKLEPESGPVRVHVDSLKPHLGRVPQVWREFLEEERRGEEIPSPSTSSSEAPSPSEEEPEHGETPSRKKNEDDTEDDVSGEEGLPTTPTKRQGPEVLGRGTRTRKPPVKLDL